MSAGTRDRSTTERGHDLTWVEPLAHDALVEFYDRRLGQPDLAHSLARAHGALWCRAAHGQPLGRELDRFEATLQRVGLGHADLAEGNAAVARELLQLTRERFRRSARGGAEMAAELAGLDERVARATA